MPAATARTAAAITQYRVRFDHAYYVAGTARLRPVAHALRVAGYVVVGLLVAFFALACALMLTVSARELAVFAVVGALLAGFLLYLRRRVPEGIERLRTVVEYRGEMQILVTSAGVELVGPGASTSLRWSVFSRAKSGTRGILLVHGDGTAVWLPDDARDVGSREDVEGVVAREIAVAARSR